MGKFQDLLIHTDNTEWILVLLGILTYYYMCKNIFTEKGAGQSILTWILWTMLDIVQFSITLIVGGDSAFLLLIFTFGGITTIAVLLKLEVQSKWTKTDTIITISVPLCVFLWFITKDPKWSIIFASLAQFLAGVPLIKKTIENPKRSYILPNIGFFVLDLISLMHAKSWKIEDSLFQIMMLVYLLIILGILFRDLYREKTNLIKSGQ